VRATDIGTFVPFQAEPAQCAQNVFFRLVGAASLIGIFDSQNKLATVLSGKAQIEQGHESCANVRVTGG
jgi:hypothetical protein